MITPEKLAAVSTAVHMVEGAAAQVASAPTGEQKLQAALGVVAAVDPNVSAWIIPAETLVKALVGVYNLFGVFKKK